MGYGTRNNGQITTFTPDDTDVVMYLCHTNNMEEIWDKIQAKWPGITMDKIQIEAEYIHTDCLTYDRYDSGDWANYLVITKKD